VKPMAPPLSERQKPGLSETLPHERHPEVCQGCGKRDSVWTRWEECDPFDRPSGVVVVLCAGCSERLVGPHARLYVRLDPGVPRPGAMALCAACQHREELRCRHPDLKANGGRGLAIHAPRVIGIMCGGGCQPIRDGIPRECRGRVVRGEAVPDLYGSPAGRVVA
jgi:hypothetical protein